MNGHAVWFHFLPLGGWVSSKDSKVKIILYGTINNIKGKKKWFAFTFTCMVTITNSSINSKVRTTK